MLLTVYTVIVYKLYFYCIYSDCIYKNIMMLKSIKLYENCIFDLYTSLYIQCIYIIYILYIQRIYRGAYTTNIQCLYIRHISDGYTNCMVWKLYGIFTVWISIQCIYSCIYNVYTVQNCIFTVNPLYCIFTVWYIYCKCKYSVFTLYLHCIYIVYTFTVNIQPVYTLYIHAQLVTTHP